MVPHSHPHLTSLAHKHQALHDAVADEESRPRPDPHKLATLKREKLAIKDTMHAFAASLDTQPTPA